MARIAMMMLAVSAGWPGNELSTLDRQHVQEDVVGQPSAWYAVFTKPHYEKLAASSLQGKGYDALLPLYPSRARTARPSDRSQLPLFPRYFFCRFDVTKRLPILTVPGVIGLVSSGRAPLEVMPDEIAAVEKIMQSGLPPSPHAKLGDGQRVVITRGPLKGVHGFLISRKSTHRLVVIVSILGRGVSVEIDVNWAAPVQA